MQYQPIKFMKLSIITVNLNNRDGLQRTIDSVVSQTFTDYEWIVIDGGSTDGSRELIEQYQDHFAYWCSEPDKGIYNAMNKGIAHAQGEWLQFLNSGDWLCDSTTLERCFAHKFDADIVYGDLYLCQSNQIMPKKHPDLITLRYLLNNTLCHNATFIRNIILQSDNFNEKLKIVSDREFFFKQILNNKTFKHINEFLICYDMNGISATNGELMAIERDNVIKQLIPEALLVDYRQMEKMEKALNETTINKVLKYGKKRRIFHKMITGCLLIIELLDKMLWKKGKSQS